MRLAVLNDLPVAGAGTSGVGSGAELTIGRFQAEGLRRGHSVDVVWPDFVTPSALAEYDLLVVKNVTAFRPEQMDEVMRHPYVCWPSDYAFTRYRLFFAFQPEVKRLTRLGAVRALFTGSRFNVFLSPLHKEAYEWVMPELAAFPESIISPPPVDERFLGPRPAGVPWERDTACTVNGGLPFKGLHANLDWCYAHPGVAATWIGGMREAVELPPNSRFVGPMPLGQLYEVMLRTETYFELPKTVQPFNQSVVQGFFACRRVVTNELMGAASFDWFKKCDRDAGRRMLRSALPTLWERLEKEVGS